MIEIKNLSLSYGAQTIYDNANLVVNARDRIGLVGKNGAGKSTLLKILAGLEEPDGGEIVKPNYATIGYLPQEAIVAGNRTLFDEAELAFADVVGLRARLAEADAALASKNADSPEYADALASFAENTRRLEDMEAHKLRSKVETVLMGLGFKMADMQRPCSEFSGGWQMRIALAKLLLQTPALLMLDEPTNHLDIESVAWLEDYLKNYSGAILLVSHDRAFLDNLTNRTVHVWHGRLDPYSGNYEFFLRESAARREAVNRAAASQQREIAKTEKFIERFRYKSSKAAQVQSRIKALDKIERIETEREDTSKIRFSFPEPKRCGQVVLEVENVSKAFGSHKVLDGISFKIERGEKVALVGVNGAGKSTLARIIAGELAADAGRIRLGLNVLLAYFAQHQTQTLEKSNTVYDEASSAAALFRKPEVRGLLGCFLFSGDDVLKKVGVLSGGEKNRLALVKILLKDFNFLLLDEPTNHLDMDSKGVLQQALQSYSGTTLIVSHDRAFLDPIVNRVIELSPSGLRFFNGNLSYYVERLKEEGRIAFSPSAEKPASGGASSADDYKRRKQEARAMRAELGKLRREVKKIESDISDAEKDLENIELEMADPDFFKKGAQCASVIEAYNTLKSKIDALYADWEKTTTRVAELEDSEKA